MELDWQAIFQQRPDLAPPGYEDAVRQAITDSKLRYERNGRRRAGVSGKSKAATRFNSLKHGVKP